MIKINELKIFEKEEFGQVRCLEIDNEPWFVGKDVAEALGYKNVRNAVPKHVDEEDKLCTQIEYAGQRRETTLINESGLYSLILSSKLPSAKQFKRWVTSEVLPELRKTGGYSVQNLTGLSPETVALMKATEALVMIEKKQNELESKVDNTNQRIDSISDLIVLSPKNWRIESEKIIMMIAEARGGTQYIAVTRKEIYNAMDQRLGKRLFDRLKRRRRRMRINGATETAIKRLSILDIIETSNDSKTLIEGYLFILKETAIKYGVDKVIIENKPEFGLVS